MKPKFTTWLRLSAFTLLVSSSAFAQNADGDVLVFQSGATLERYSNLFRLPAGVDPTPLYGGSGRSDSLLRGLLGFGFDRLVSQQRLKADAKIEPTWYRAFPRFDYLGYAGGVSLDWLATRTLTGTVGMRSAQTITSFLADRSGSGDRNLERRHAVFGTAGLRVTPDWSVVLGLDQTRLDNSLNLSYFQSANNTQTSAEAGVRYASGTGNEFSIVARNTRGDYPILQTVDALGNLLPAGADNTFRQHALLLRLQQAPSDDSRIRGELGYTRRDYTMLASRDFSGVTASLSAEWKPSGAISARAELVRDIASPMILSSNYVDLTEIRLQPTIALTGKISLNARASVARLAYKGDPGLVITTGAQRHDDLTVLGAGLSYEALRNLVLSLNLTRESRSSNYEAFRFDNTIVGLGIVLRL